MPARTAAERLSSFGSRKVKRLFRSTSEVTFALPACLPKIQVGLPVAEHLPVADLGRPVLDPALARDRRGARPSAVAGPAPAPRLGQVAVEAVLAALGAVD